MDRYFRLGTFAVWFAAWANPILAVETTPVRLDERRQTWIAGGFYEGDIGGTPFQMNLEYPRPGAAQSEAWIYFTSEYWYPRRVTNGRIPLKTVSPVGDAKQFLLEGTVKFDAQNNRAYKERFSGTWNRDRTEAQGTWSSELNGKALPFHMKLRIQYQAESISFLTPTAIKDFERRRTFHSTVYPAFTDPTLATLEPTLGVIPTKSGTEGAKQREVENDEETEDALMITWASDEYVFLRQDDSYYGFGAAHPTANTSFSHYKRTENGFKLVRMGEFLADDGKCLKQLSDAVVAALEKDDASNPEAGALVKPPPPPGAKRHKAIAVRDNGWSNYLFSPMGVEFFFGQYSIGGYAEVHDVFIEKARLEKCVKQLLHYAPVIEPL